MSGHVKELEALREQVKAMKDMLIANGMVPPKPHSGRKSGREAASKPSALVVVASSNEPALGKNGWKTLPTKKSDPSQNGQPLDTLSPDGWSVPIRAGIQEPRASPNGVCLVTGKSARTVAQEFAGEGAFAVLSPINIDSRGSEMNVLVTDKEGKERVRQRFLIQLGTEDVKFVSVVPRVTMQEDTMKVIVIIDKDVVDPDIWKSTEVNPRGAARHWLSKRVGASVLDVAPATRLASKPNSLQCVAAVAASSAPMILKASGKDKVQTMPFCTTSAERSDYSLEPLPCDVIWETAMGKTEWLGGNACGVLRTSKGWGIRVKAEDRDGTLMTLRPDDWQALEGKKYCISGLPLGCGSESLQAALSSWSFNPLYSFRQKWSRTWVVRAGKEPVSWKFQHDFGIGLISPWEEERRQPRKPSVQIFRRGTDTSPNSTMPKSWAAVVASSNASSGRPVTNQRAPETRMIKAPSEGLQSGSQAPAVAAGVDVPMTPPAALLGAPDLAAIVQAAVAAAMSSTQAQLAALQSEIMLMKSSEDGEILEDAQPPSAQLQQGSDTRYSPF